MSVFRNICVIFTLFVAILATGSYLFASSSTPTRMTVNVFHDKNNNGEKNSNEPWLEGISITFDHTGVDLFFDGKVDELRPENNDTHFTKTTDVNGFLQFDTQLGFLYAKVSYPEKFSYIEQRTRKFHFRYAGEHHRWFLGLAPKPTPKPEPKPTPPEPDDEKEPEQSPEPEEDLTSATPPDDTLSCFTPSYKTCGTAPRKGFLAYADDLACEGIIKEKKDCEGYKCERPISRAEVIGMGVKMTQEKVPRNYACKGRFTDSFGPGVPSWICRSLELGVEYNVFYPSKNATTYDPNKQATRVFSYGLLMNSVCMSKREASIEGFDESIGLTEWEKTVVRTAQKHGLTKRSDTDFKAKRPILRQELFIVASKLLEWAQETGGCERRKMCK